MKVGDLVRYQDTEYTRSGRFEDPDAVGVITDVYSPPMSGHDPVVYIVWPSGKTVGWSSKGFQNFLRVVQSSEDVE